MFLPIRHNGQIFNLAPQDSFHHAFRVMLDRETFASDVDCEQGCPEDITEHLGSFTIDHHYGSICAWTKYGYGTTFYSINEAVAHIADNYRQCNHGNATCMGGTAWNCDDCGADFTQADEDAESDEQAFYRASGH